MPKQTRKGFTHGEAPKGGPPYLIVRLNPGWRLADDGGAFESANERVEVPAKIGANARLVHHIPALAARTIGSLSGPEKELARFAQLRAEDRRALTEAAKTIKQLACVESVGEPPETALP